MTIPELARKAAVDPTTIRRFIKGKTWPHPGTRQKLAEALGWELGDTMRFAAMRGYVTLEGVTTQDLVAELCVRFNCHPRSSGAYGPETPDVGDFVPDP